MFLAILDLLWEWGELREGRNTSRVAYEITTVNISLPHSDRVEDMMWFRFPYTCYRYLLIREPVLLDLIAHMSKPFDMTVYIN
jgi:hypothetical protein